MKNVKDKFPTETFWVSSYPFGYGAIKCLGNLFIITLKFNKMNDSLFYLKILILIYFYIF